MQAHTCTYAHAHTHAHAQHMHTRTHTHMHTHICSRIYDHAYTLTHICSPIYHHHHSFNVSVPLKVGRMAPMFVPSFFLHSILFAGSALDSFQCLRSLLIVSFHVFFGLPRPRCDAVNTTIIPYNMPKPT